MQVDSEDHLLSIPCTALGRDPTVDEVALLGVLVHQQRAWKGMCSLRQMETQGIRTSSSVTRIADGVYDVGGELCCVHGASVVMFEDRAHMQLYLSILEAGPLSFYSPLCSALAIEVGARHSEVRLSLFEGPPSLLDQLHSETLWLRLVSLLWHGAESVSLEKWETERYKGEHCLETNVLGVIAFDDPFAGILYPTVRVSRTFILLQRDGKDRHERCMFVLVRHTERVGLVKGSVLFVSYVGYEGRVSYR